jgi:hypothetical protein
MSFTKRKIDTGIIYLHEDESLPEDSRESVENSKVLINKLEGLIKDGLKLNKVNITKAIRKKSRLIIRTDPAYPIAVH